MFKCLAIVGAVLAVVALNGAPASAKHHQGEKPEPGHHGGKHTLVQVQPADDHGKNRGKDGVNDKVDDHKNDGPGHK